MVTVKKKQQRAGIIPYFIEPDGRISMLFMKPSNPKYGGDVFQIAKGRVEDGETNKDAATREGGEELGLFNGNISSIVSVGTFLGYTEFFICLVNDKDMFGDPHFETGTTQWMTPEEFSEYGRSIHKHVVAAAERKIRTRKK